MPEPVVTELVEIRRLALGEDGSRGVVVRWSDGNVSEALRFYADEILVSEGDLVGLTQTQVRSLRHRRDVEYLQRDDSAPHDTQPFWEP